MDWLVIISGIVAIGHCLSILISPNVLRKTIDFLSIGSRVYLAGIIRLILGAMLLILATYSRLWGYVVIIGLLAAASGLTIFFLPLRRTKNLLGRIQKQNDLWLRLLVFIPLAIWLLLIYAIFPVELGF